MPWNNVKKSCTECHNKVKVVHTMKNIIIKSSLLYSMSLKVIQKIMLLKKLNSGVHTVHLLPHTLLQTHSDSQASYKIQMNHCQHLTANSISKNSRGQVTFGVETIKSEMQYASSHFLLCNNIDSFKHILLQLPVRKNDKFTNICLQQWKGVKRVSCTTFTYRIWPFFLSWK